MKELWLPKVETFGAYEMGWRRRTDLGPTVWERPDGTLYHHYNEREPALQREGYGGPSLTSPS